MVCARLQPVVGSQAFMLAPFDSVLTILMFSKYGVTVMILHKNYISIGTKRSIAQQNITWIEKLV